jgi:hypothetical protein
MKNINEESGFKASIERGINFSREDYESKREKSNAEMVDFDDFIKNVAESIEENEGTIEDAVLIANDAFLKL